MKRKLSFGNNISDNLITISGIQIKFPYSPYPSQLGLMKTLITGLQTKENCMIESPTGSGKTMALLCASIAWQRSLDSQNSSLMDKSVKCDDDDFELEIFSPNLYTLKKKSIPSIRPKIIYATRTHEQIRQVIDEVKKSAYSDIRMTILSSKKQTCVEPRVNTFPGNRNLRCQQLIKNGLCGYFSGLNNLKKISSLDHFATCGAWDIEDIINFGNCHKICPHFSAFYLVSEADLIVCPYFYLTDLKAQGTPLPLKGNVVIFDEGHHLDQFCRHSCSFEVDLNAIDKTSDFLMNFTPPNATVGKYWESVHTISSKISNFCKSAAKPERDVISGDIFCSYTGFDMLERFVKMGIGPEEHGALNEIYKLTMSTPEEFYDKKILLNDRFSEAYSFITRLTSVLKLIYKDHQNLCNDFRLIITENDQNEINFKIVCLTARLAFSSLDKNARMVAVTSGTLSPFELLIKELSVEFPHKFSGKPVFSSSNFWVGCVSMGPDNVLLRGVKSNRTDDHYVNSLGKSLIRLISIIPNGVICFFPSHPFYSEVSSRWKLNGMMKQMTDIKPIFFEIDSNSSIESSNIFKSYINAATNPKGAVLFCTCRGRMSEGVNFSDEASRAVIIVGEPFMTKSPEVVAKIEYNKEMFENDSKNSWMVDSMLRLVNQSLGRCLRNSSDWACMILMDCRFWEHREGLFRWICEELTPFNSFDHTLGLISEFISKKQIEYPCKVATKDVEVPFQNENSVKYFGCDVYLVLPQRVIEIIDIDSVDYMEVVPYSPQLNPELKKSSFEESSDVVELYGECEQYPNVCRVVCGDSGNEVFFRFVYKMRDNL